MYPGWYIRVIIWYQLITYLLYSSIASVYMWPNVGVFNVGLCCRSNLLLEYLLSTLASTRVLTKSIYLMFSVEWFHTVVVCCIFLLLSNIFTTPCSRKTKPPDRLSRKFAIQCSVDIPPHLTYVTTVRHTLTITFFNEELKIKPNINIKTRSSEQRLTHNVRVPQQCKQGQIQSVSNTSQLHYLVKHEWPKNQHFVGFSVIRVSQGSVATYVRCGGMST